MASSPLSQHSHITLFAPVAFLVLLVWPSAVVGINVTAVLAGYPELSGFSRLLVTTGVAGDLVGRSSVTLLAVPNSYLLNSSDPVQSAADIADVVRYHVLLEYISWPDLRRIPAAGKLVTTLYQTTGRAAANLGNVNLTRGPGGVVTARSPAPFSASNATILNQVEAFPYNVSVFTVDGLLVPFGFNLAASESRPPPPLNITQVLVEGRDFNVVASMLAASGVASELEADERGAGITVFVPTDEAFAMLPVTERLQSLPADRKVVVLRFHVLHSYYPLGSLESIVNPVQPTLATEDTGAGRFTLNITRVNGSVAIGTGIGQASITRTVFDQNPVAVFAVSRVLLPREIFSDSDTGAGAGGGGREMEGATAPPPAEEGAPAPEGAAGGDTPPTRLSSPPGLIGGIKSAGSGRSHGIFNTGGGRHGGALLCIGLLYPLLV